MTETQSESINDSLTIDLRPRLPRRQARIRSPNGKWHRFSTGKSDIAEAKDKALKHCSTADFNQKNTLPPFTRKVRCVAELARPQMQEELDAGGGQVGFKDSITANNRYLVPFFGNREVASIKDSDPHAFDTWRTRKLGWGARDDQHPQFGTEPAAGRSTDTWRDHRVDPPVADQQGQVGRETRAVQRQGMHGFHKTMRTWFKSVVRQDRRERRAVLRNNLVVLANPGVRHGAEATRLEWKGISWFENDGEPWLSICIGGKTGGRELIARQNTRSGQQRP
ncbi:MAG: hypothetical protein LPK12_16215 [Rhodobacterales bacterium]|nr:hypothetical protein [Rhodobacterales bacterium]MDX5501489.1 hypothetical protein [Rhodobacterales bacterium]